MVCFHVNDDGVRVLRPTSSFGYAKTGTRFQVSTERMEKGRNRSNDRWFTRRVSLPLLHGGFVIVTSSFESVVGGITYTFMGFLYMEQFRTLILKLSLVPRSLVRFLLWKLLVERK